MVINSKKRKLQWNIQQLLKIDIKISEITTQLYSKIIQILCKRGEYNIAYYIFD